MLNNLVSEQEIMEELSKLQLNSLDELCSNTMCFLEIDSGYYNTVKIDGRNYAFQVHQIESETKVSYVTTHGYKINKKTLTYVDRYTGCCHKVKHIYGVSCIMKALWAHINSYKIAEKVTYCKDYDILKEICALLEG